MGEGLSMQQQQQMRRAVCDIIGAPWRLLGRGPDGVDCLGMVLWLYAQVGVTLPDPTLTSGTFADALELASFFHRVPPGEPPRIGDVVQFPAGKYGTHLAVYMDGNLMQANEDNGVFQLPFKRFVAARQGVALNWFRLNEEHNREACAE